MIFNENITLTKPVEITYFRLSSHREEVGLSPLTKISSASDVAVGLCSKSATEDLFVCCRGPCLPLRALLVYGWGKPLSAAGDALSADERLVRLPMRALVSRW